MNEFIKDCSPFYAVKIEDYIAEFGGRKSAARILTAVAELDDALTAAGIPHNCSLDYIVNKVDNLV